MARNRALLFDQLLRVSNTDRPWVVDHFSAAVNVYEGTVHRLDIAQATARAASFFLDEGFGAGDYCGVWLDSPLDVLISAAALTAVGAVPMLISPIMDADTLARVLSTVDSVKGFVTTPERHDTCAGIERVGTVYEWSVVVHMSSGLGQLAAGVRLPEDAPYIVTHTSGTTGVPKLVQYTRSAIDHQSRIQETIHRFTGIKGYAAVSISPVHSRSVVGLLTAMRRGVPLMILQSSEPDVVRPYFERWKPEYLETHPNTFMEWESLADSGSLASVKWFLNSFDVIHPGTVQRLLRGSKSSRAIYAEMYAQSEVGPIAAKFHIKGIRGFRRTSSIDGRLRGHPVGVAIPGHSRIRIVDEDGRRTAAGTGGRIQVRSRGRFSTYVNFPQKASDNLAEDGWWDTGDFGRKDRYGRVLLIDRQVERLSRIPSGIAMEDLLLERMPWLLEAVVLELEGVVIPVVTARKDDFDSHDWKRSVEDLPELGDPIVLNYDQYPKTATGKVQRSVLTQYVRALSPDDPNAHPGDGSDNGGLDEH